MTHRLLAAAALAGALLAPAAASAKDAPPSTPVRCAQLTALSSGVVDKPASHKPITADFKLSNCGSATATFTTSLVATAFTVTSFDPYTVRECATAPYVVSELTLKPGETRSFEGLAKLPYCGYSTWGVDNGYDVRYDATVSDGAGAVTTGSTTVLHRGGV